MSKDQPVYVMQEGTNRTSGRPAQKNNILAAKIVAEIVRTTLGPKGMDKMIVDSLGDVIVTNDGVTILKEMQIEHPAAKMLVEISKTQEDEVGDGTTSAVVIAGELLKNAESLLEKNIHPTVLAKGYRLAANRAHEVLETIATHITEKDTDILRKIATTAMTGKGAEHAKEHLADITVKAAKQIWNENAQRDDIMLEKKVGGAVHDTELVQGIVIDKERVHAGMPTHIQNAKVLLIDSPIEIKDTETDAKISITDPLQLQSFVEQEEKMLQQMVEQVEATGATAVFCQKGIDDLAQHFLAKRGIYAVRRVKKSDIESLSKATGATTITKLKEASKNDLGFAGSIAQKKVGDDDMTFIMDCKHPKAVTILVRGGTNHVIDEVKRALEDAIGDVYSALKSKKVIAGAGAPEMELAKQLKEYASSLSGREQLAVQAFSDAVEVIPRTLSENAGLDPIDVMTALRAAHDKKQPTAGIDVFTGKVVDAWKKGVIEPLAIKTQAISSAAEVAEMILRIDDVIAGAKEQTPPMPPDMGGMM